MNKKKFLSFLLLSIFLFLSFQIIISDSCKNKKILNKIENLGLGYLTECYNEFEIKDKIKKIVKVNKPLYDLTAKIKVTLLPNFGKSRDIYQTFDFTYDYKRKNFETKKNLKGIYSNEKILKKYSIEKRANELNKSWERSHGNNYNNKFFNSDKINEQNIKNLKLSWSHASFSNNETPSKWKSRIGINPIYHNGIVYYVSADWKLNALKADNGETIWVKEFTSEIGRRGILFHKSFILINSGKKIYKINAVTGEIDKKFGTFGSVNIGKSQVAPVVYKNIILLPNIKNQIVGIDFLNGEILFKVSIHENYDFKLYAIAWSGAAVDVKNGIYYIVTGNPKPYHVGIFRPGENKNANSIIAFDINKKKIIWSFQDVRHDLWNLDLSAPPIITDLEIKDHLIETVIVTTKTGNILIFERKTGLPIFDIDYVKVPKSNVPGEIAADKQILIKTPEKFSKIEFKLEDLRDEFLNDEKFIKKFKEKSIWGFFQPPTLGKDTIIYGLIGGNNWYGSAYNPIKNKLYIPSNHVPFLIKVFPISKNINLDIFSNDKYFQLYQNNCSSCHGKRRNGIYSIETYEKNIDYIPSIVGTHIFDQLSSDILNYDNLIEKHNNKFNLTKKDAEGIKNLFFKWDNELKKNNKIGFESYYKLLISDDKLPLTKPPWGTISEVDLVNGKIKWKIPFGYYNDKNIGVTNVGGVSINANLIFANGTSDNYAFVFRANDGKELWKYKMPAAGTAPPLIYEYNNKQYVSFLSTGGIDSDSERNSVLLTFSIN